MKLMPANDIQYRALQTYIGNTQSNMPEMLQIVMGLAGDAGVLVKEYKKFLFRPDCAGIDNEIIKEKSTKDG